MDEARGRKLFSQLVKEYPISLIDIQNEYDMVTNSAVMLIPESFGAANRKLDFEPDLQQSPGDDDIHPAQHKEQEVIQPVSSSAENTTTNGDAAIVSLSIDNMEKTNSKNS